MQPIAHASWSRAARLTVVTFAAGVLLAGCAQGPGGLDLAGSGPATGVRKPEAATKTPADSLAALAKSHAEKPADADVALRYARALKAAGRTPEALAVLQAAREAAPDRGDVLAMHGLLALEAGKSKEAHASLTRAAAGAGAKDWRVLSGLGVAAASLGKQAEAQKHLKRALELSPNNPAVLNNLALAYVLDAKPQQAEPLLRKARNGPETKRVAGNLEIAMAMKREQAEAAEETSAATE